MALCLSIATAVECSEGLIIKRPSRYNCRTNFIFDDESIIPRNRCEIYTTDQKCISNQSFIDILDDILQLPPVESTEEC